MPFHRVIAMGQSTCKADQKSAPVGLKFFILRPGTCLLFGIILHPPTMQKIKT
jgi:hypothetical protein